MMPVKNRQYEACYTNVQTLLTALQLFMAKKNQLVSKQSSVLTLFVCNLPSVGRLIIILTLCAGHCMELCKVC